MKDYYDNKNNLNSYIKLFSSKEIYIPVKTGEYFSIAILCSGFLEIVEQNLRLPIQAPAILCFNNQQDIHIQSTHGIFVKTILFKPSFINKDLSISGLSHGNDFEYDLFLKHAYNQMIPFMIDDKKKRMFQLNTENFSLINEYYDKCIYQLKNKPDSYWFCLVHSYFMSIIQNIEFLFYNEYINKNILKENSNQNDFYELLSFIDTHIDTDITLKSICHIFNTYENRIEELFKDNLNVTFYEYVRNKRFERICYYLRFTDLKAKEIAFKVGISSSQNLCKLFKAISGKTPNQFRKEFIFNNHNSLRQSRSSLTKLVNQD